MKEVTLGQLAQWCNGTLDPQFANVIVNGVTTDSREVKEGQLFIPLVGNKFDGHNYIRKARADGATACLSQREDQDADYPVIYVKDTLLAFGEIAKGYRMDNKAKVFAVTGSVGKTTTKEMIAAMLRMKMKTVWTKGNHNNNLGLPLSIMRINEDTDIAVLEMGMNHFGEMSYLTQIAKPDIAVFTNIGTMHIENLGSRAGILKAKMELLEGMTSDGILILNGDEPLLWHLKDELTAKMKKVIYFGITNQECNLVAHNIVSSTEGVRFTVECCEGTFPVFVPANGQHTIYNAMAAIAAGIMAQMTNDEMVEALSIFENTGSRQKIYEQNGYTIIEDCYNAGPESMAAALQVLGERKGEGRRIAVLGDMLELGAASTAEHYRVGRLAKDSADLIFAYGVNAKRVGSGAVTGGMKPNAVHTFDDQDALIHKLRMKAKKGDILLFKGSRGMKMERALRLFLEEK